MSEQTGQADRFAYYDREADILWIPLGAADSVFNERADWGLVDLDKATRSVVGVEIWNAAERLPADLLEKFPPPSPPSDS
jgi:uncharacterized protein YuzE